MLCKWLASYVSQCSWLALTTRIRVNSVHDTTTSAVILYTVHKARSHFMCCLCWYEDRMGNHFCTHPNTSCCNKATIWALCGAAEWCSKSPALAMSLLATLADKNAIEWVLGGLGLAKQGLNYPPASNTSSPANILHIHPKGTLCMPGPSLCFTKAWLLVLSDHSRPAPWVSSMFPFLSPNSEPGLLINFLHILANSPYLEIPPVKCPLSDLFFSLSLLHSISLDFSSDASGVWPLPTWRACPFSPD